MSVDALLKKTFTSYRYIHNNFSNKPFSEKYEFKIFFFSEDQNYFKPLKEF